MIKNPYKATMPNDFFALVEKAKVAKLTDDTCVRTMLSVLSNDINDKELIDVFSWETNKSFLVDECDKDEFKDCYPQSQDEIGVITNEVWQIGDSLRNNIIVCVDKSKLIQGGVLIIGPTGTRKTTILKNFIIQMVGENITIVIFTRKKHELDDVTGERIRYWTPDNIKISAFQMRDPANKLANLIAKGRLYASKRFAMEGIEMYLQKYREQIEKTGTYPGLQGLYDFIKNDPVFSKKHPLSRSGQYREAVLYVLAEIIQGSRGIYNCGWSNFLELLEEEGTGNIIDVSSLEENATEFLYEHIIGNTYNERMNSEEKKTPIIFASDDSFEQYHKRQDEKSETGLGNTSLNFLMGRWQGIGQIGLIQDASCLPERIINNAKIIILTGLWGGDFRVYQRMLSLTDEMIEQIRGFPPGVAVIKLNGIWPYAFPIKLRPYAGVSNES